MASLSSAASTRGVALPRGSLTSKTTSRCRASSLVVRAEDKMARNSIDLSKRKLDKGTGAPVNVTFLGAGGQEVVVQCPEDQYILDAAIDAGLELPYTCRGGICGAYRRVRAGAPGRRRRRACAMRRGSARARARSPVHGPDLEICEIIPLNRRQLWYSAYCTK